jgi:dCMP deaminase
MNWDEYFMSMCYFIAMKSKDQNTKNGSVIVGPDNEIRSTGYNSFPRGINDNLQERQERPEKYYWLEHGERNSIYNAARIGVSLKDCRMYTLGTPCMDCARGIVQSGISEVITHKKWDDSNIEIWNEHAKKSLTLFKEANIKFRIYNDKIISVIKSRKNKEEFFINE